MNQKGLAPILIVLILAVALIGGYLIYQNQPKSISSPQPTTQSSPTSDETVNWETYTDEFYQFNYPTHWKQPLKSKTIDLYWDEFEISETKFNDLPYEKDLDRKIGILPEIASKEDYLKIKNSIEGQKLPTRYTNNWKFVNVGGKNAIQAYVYAIPGGIYIIETQVFTDNIGLVITSILPLEPILKEKEPGQEYEEIDIPKSQQIEAQLNAGTYKSAEIDKTVGQYRKVLSTFKFYLNSQ